MNVLFAVSEAVPLIKTGGLADVAGSLPGAMDPECFDCRVVMPLYRTIGEEWRSRAEFLESFQVPFCCTWKYAGLFSLRIGKVLFYLIDNEEYFGDPVPYQGGRRDIEKFLYFEKAVLEFIRRSAWRPDVVHCHDWQTALLPALLREAGKIQPELAGIRTVFTIHNLKFQGIWNMDEMRFLSGLPEDCFSLRGLEYYGNASMMKGGILWSDAVTTVSETYAGEILTPEYGEGLDGLLREQNGKLSGILNGIDTSAYDPRNDSMICETYTLTTVRKQKIRNKLSLQKTLGLEEDPEAFLAGIVSRLTDQKGMDLLSAILEDLMRAGVQLAVIGTGEERYERQLMEAAGRYPGRLAAVIRFSESLAHQVYAASDVYLMPSRFEPCGLSQLIAMRYGTLPVVRETGGLKDTVIPYNRYTGEGTGFSFAGYDPGEFKDCVFRAEETRKTDPKSWGQLIRQAMKADFSWTVSARKYQALYRKLCGKGQE